MEGIKYTGQKMGQLQMKIDRSTLEGQQKHAKMVILIGHADIYG